jgi:GNAT superfamily N-acetyltransferase
MKRTAVVREATIEDAEGIARVHVDSWRSAYRGLVPDSVLDGLSVERRTRGWRDWISGRTPVDAELGCVLVAELNDEVVGFLNAGACRDPDAGDETGEIRAIYVLADAWDTGTGALLMNAGVEWLRERFTHATLWVLEGNDRGRRFYEKGGWSWDGARQQLDFDGTDLPEIRYRVDF